MKVKKLKLTETSDKTSTTQLVRKSQDPRAALPMVEIRHDQSVKLSINYNSAETRFGVTLTVPDTEKDIQKGKSRAVIIVESALVPKVKEQRELLRSLS